MFYVIWVQTQKEYEFKIKFEKKVNTSLYGRLLFITRIEKQKHRDSFVEKEKVMFPGYLFVETDYPEEIHEILCSQPEYIKILGNDGEFYPLTEREEEFLNRITGYTERVDMSIGIIDSGVVKILSGPLSGFEQYIVKVDRHKRKAYLEMELFGEVKKIVAGLEIVAKS
jgi:transcriptional antiterminator NusG